MYEQLLSPGRIGRLELGNRIAMAPMGVEIVDADGLVREPLIRYYEERARGGAGLLISEVCAVAYPRGANSAHQISLASDDALPGLRELASRVQRHGAKLALQLVHHGKVSRLDIQQGREVLMPSEPRFRGANDQGSDLSAEELRLVTAAFGGLRAKIRPATHADLAEVVEAFAAAALRCRLAGVDGVEVHAAHGYLLAEFLSPAWNFRTDEYGGSIENRARLLCEVLRACKQRAGADYPVWCRIDAVEFRTPGGIRFDDARRTAEIAAEAGADAIHVSAYADSSSAVGFTDAPLPDRAAAYVEYAAGIRARVNVPVIAVGRIEPELGDQLIREGRADFIAMARKLLADPELPRKLAEGRPGSVRPCIYCYTCVAQAFFDRSVRCAVNPATAHEGEFADTERSRAAQPKRVVIVGGGPAGMEAARVAARRGHQVTLFEKERRLGGSLRFAGLVYEPNERLLRWLEHELRREPVVLRLGEAATPEAIAALAPDQVWVAVGAKRVRAAIPGADLPQVFDGEDLRGLLAGDAPEVARRLAPLARIAVRAGRWLGVSAEPGRLRRASRWYLPLGRRVVIVGGGLVGLELAAFLAERERRVAVLEQGEVLGIELAHPRRWRLLHELRSAKVELVTRAHVRAIRPGAVDFERESDAGAALSESRPADAVLLAIGLEANPSFAAALRARGLAVREIGDCAGVGYLEGAIQSGFRAAAEL